MMGLRPGSKTDTLADHQAYGATTLQARHVKRMGSGAIWLDFTGKKGVHIHLKVWDIRLGDLLFLKKEARQGRRIVPIFNVSNSALNAYIKSLSPGCNPKDFRTLKANVVAAEFMEGKRIPKQKTKAKLMLRNLFIHVAKVLANTPAIVKKSYVSPDVYKPLTDVIGG
jgi:DNA topoisomerase-1